MKDFVRSRFASISRLVSILFGTVERRAKIGDLEGFRI